MLDLDINLAEAGSWLARMCMDARYNWVHVFAVGQQGRWDEHLPHKKKEEKKLPPR